MDSRRGILLAAGLLIVGVIAGGCSEAIPTLAPPAPSMVTYVDDPFAENGIRATPDAVADSGGAGGIKVEWYALDPKKVTGVPVGGYYLYRSRNRTVGELKENPTFVRVQKTEGDTSFIDTDVEVGYIYSYYVTAYNRSDNTQESVASDTVHFQPTVRPVAITPSGTISLPTNGALRFFFGPAGQIGGPNVGIEINEVAPNNEDILLRRIWRSVDENPSFDTGYIDYNGEIPLTPGRYRWRIFSYFHLYSFPGEPDIPAGNTSTWQAFVIQ